MNENTTQNDTTKDLLIVVGNGYDLARGLKTSYSDFMEYLRYKGSESGEKEGSSFQETLDYDYIGYEKNSANFKFYSKRINIGNSVHSKFSGVCYDRNKKNIGFSVSKDSIYYKTLIGTHDKLKSWADLEQFYFDTLYKHRADNNAIIKINEEFTDIKTLFINYLSNLDIPGRSGSSYYLSDNGVFNKFIRGGACNINNQPSYNKHLVVNFNYTEVFEEVDCSFFSSEKSNIIDRSNSINIHGDLEDEASIVFGYGDDNSEKYRELLNSGNNELLKNFKTFQYQRNKRYSDLMGRLNLLSEDFDILVVGHSCGVTDKALLKTIFEHKNAGKINLAHHLNEKGESDYLEKVYNLARIFDDPAKLRGKVLPQHGAMAF